MTDDPARRGEAQGSINLKLESYDPAPTDPSSKTTGTGSSSGGTLELPQPTAQEAVMRLQHEREQRILARIIWAVDKRSGIRRDDLASVVRKNFENGRVEERGVWEKIMHEYQVRHGEACDALRTENARQKDAAEYWKASFEESENKLAAAEKRIAELEAER